MGKMLVKNTQIVTKALGIMAFTAFGSMALADDENPTAEWKAPHTPPLYETQAKTNGGSVYGGLGLQLGQSRSLEGGSAGVAKAAALQLGYTGNISSWRRYEAGVELVTGGASYRLSGTDGEKGTLDWKLGIVLTAGYGVNFSNGFYGLWQVGIGSVTSEYQGDLPDGRTLAGDKPGSGLLMRAGYALVSPLADRGEVLAGFRMSQYQTDVARIRTTSPDGSTLTGGGKGITLNIPEFHVGLRWKM